MSFTPAEVAYLEARPPARLSTTDEHGQPDVVPLAFQLDGTHIWIGGAGDTYLATRKVRNIKAGRRDVALVVDDMRSVDPFIARGIRIYGRADDPIERMGLVGPGWYVRIVPTVSWSWNLRGDQVGDEWCPASRTDHRTTTGEA